MTMRHVARRTFASRVVTGMLSALLAFTVLAASAQPRQTGLPATEWKAIEAIVGAQLAALKAGDADKAFGFASPGIRAQFGSAATFARMVSESYSALLAARYSEFLEGAVVDGIVIKPLRLIAPDNTVLVALYTMEKQPDGSWRIAGCALAPSTVQAA
jgi:Domain of unknown function (DUF4864)